MEKGEPIYCLCHGDVVVGYRRDGKIVWYIESHGQKHYQAVPAMPLDISAKMVNTNHN